MKAKFKLTNRILSLVLALVMVVGFIPLQTKAANTHSVSGNGFTMTISDFKADGNVVYYSIARDLSLSVKEPDPVNNPGVYSFTYYVILQNGDNQAQTVYHNVVNGPRTGTFTWNDCTKSLSVTQTHTKTAASSLDNKSHTYEWKVTFTRNAFSSHALNDYTTKNPTCTDTGEKKTSCNKCTYVKSTTSIPIDSSAHNYTYTNLGNGKHKGVCKHNSAHTTPEENCSGGTASCTAAAVCTFCKNSYGSTSAHNWTQWKYDPNSFINLGHYRTCTICNPNGNNYETGYEFEFHSYSNATCVQRATCKCNKTDGSFGAHSMSYTKNGNTIEQVCANSSAHNSTIALTQDSNVSTVYTGKEIKALKPSITGYQSLSAEIVYSNNINVGTAKGTLTLGDVTIEKTFEISEADIADATITFNPENGTYDGSDKKPTVYVEYGGTALNEGTDYTISWDKADLIDADSYTATLTGIGNFEGTTTKTFDINQKEVSITWGGTNFMAYTGHLVLPEVSVTGVADGDTCEAIVSVVETVDGAGINPGQWTAKITGLTNKNYKLANDGKPLEVKYTIYANQNAPAVFGVNETIKDKNDGYISGLTTEMEYSTEQTYNDDAYTKVTDPYQIFAPGTYYVRYAAKDYYYSSKYTEVTIAQGRELTVTLPAENEQIGYTIIADKTALSYEDSVSIKIKSKDGYSKTERFAVYSNGVDVTDKFNFATNTLSLTNVTEDIEITLANGGVADITEPTAEITVDTNKWNSFLNEITFGLFFNKTQTVTINATDNGSGVDKTYYHLSSEPISEDDMNTITDWKEYNNAFNINPDNKYVVYAKIVDKAGNVSYISSDGLVLDGTGPVVLGMENGAIYHGMHVFSVEEELSDIASIKIDGVDTPFTPMEPNIYIMPDDKEHTVEVTDKAGNTTTYSVTVYKVYTVTFIAEGEAGSYEKPVKYDEVITIPTNDIFEDTFRKPGYTLTDWNGYTQGMKMPLKNLTFTAVYTPNDYTVEFDPNGGEAIAPVTVTFGEKYGRLPSSAITGLSGGDSNWYLVDQYGNLTDNKITKLTQVTQPRNHTLFIKRNVLAPSLKLTLSVPGGISDSYQYYIPGASQRVLTATVTNMNTDVLDYTYKWYKDGELINGESSDVLTLDGNVSDSGTYKVEVTAKLKNGVNIVVTSDSVTASKEQKVKILHATNTLNYDANGGEGGPQSSYTGGVSLTVSKDTPSREHYVFLGWNTKADGTGEQYKAEDVYTFADDNSNGGCVTTLYAQWKLVEYTVTYTADGKPVTTEKVEHGKNANLPAVPAKDGFVGKWDSDGKNITGDTTINAIYTAIPVVKPDEVKPQDKNDLEDVKEKLEEELKDNSYTEDDKKDIQDAIDDINDALKVIENVENVENLIDDIPDTITKDDKATINAANDAYNALTDYEKSLVDKDAKKALDNAKAALSKLYKSTDTKSPQTSDNSLIFLWFALLLMGSASVFGFSYTNRKRKATNKR